MYIISVLNLTQYTSQSNAMQRSKLISFALTSTVGRSCAYGRVLEIKFPESGDIASRRSCRINRNNIPSPYIPYIQATRYGRSCISISSIQDQYSKGAILRHEY